MLAGIVDTTLSRSRRRAVALLLAVDQHARRGRVPLPGHRSSAAKAPGPGRGKSAQRQVRHRSPAAEWNRHPTGRIAMDAVKTWTVQVDIDEHEDRTRAVARLRTGRDPLAGTGYARLNPADRNLPQIGDELAAAQSTASVATEPTIAVP